MTDDVKSIRPAQDHTESNGHDAHHDDSKIPGGLYTIVFGVLAVVTLIEVLLAESPLPRQLAYPLLAALSIGKAVLVVMYYMHLREDSRIFIWAFGVPLAMAAMIILFVMAINPVTY